MKILEAQSAILTNAEALVHVRNVHQQSLRNPEYSNRKGAKLRPLKTVIEEVHRNFQETGLIKTPLPPDTEVQTRTTAPYPRAPSNPQPKPAHAPPTSHGDERIPLEATLDLKPAEDVPLPALPRGPLVQRYDATETLLPPRASRQPDGTDGLAWIARVLGALDDAASGRGRLTKGEKLMVCNLRPRSAFELEYIVEEAEERLGGADGVETLAGVLLGVWEGLEAAGAAGAEGDAGMSG